MRISLPLLVFWPVNGLSAAVSSRTPPPTGFLAPDQGSLTWDGSTEKLPLSFNFSEIHRREEVQIDGIFWVNSFVHGSNGHDYYIASHAMNYASDIPGALPIYRASILDVTDTSYYHNYLRLAPANASFWTSSGDFSAVFDGYGMETLNKDPLQGIHTWTSLEGIEFDLSINFSSPALLNGALGSYWVNGALGWEWSVPRAATEGTITIDGEIIDVVPEKSHTWYDRQWGSIPDSFDWIMLHFEESDWFDMSLFGSWSWTDSVNGPAEFATVRFQNGRHSTLPTTVIPSEEKVYISPETGIVYPLEWIMMIEDVEILVTTPRADQVIEADPSTGFPSQFSGYVDAVARKAGHKPVRGYGAVDHMMIP